MARPPLMTAAAWPEVRRKSVMQLLQSSTQLLQLDTHLLMRRRRPAREMCIMRQTSPAAVAGSSFVRYEYYNSFRHYIFPRRVDFRYLSGRHQTRTLQTNTRTEHALLSV